MNYEHVHNVLEKWLNEKRPDYQDGLAILMSYEDKPMLCKQLQQYNNPEKLYESLMKLFARVKGKAATQVPDKKVVKVILEEARKNPSDVPKDKVLKELHSQGIMCLKEIDSVKSQLYMLGRNPATESTMPLSDGDMKQRLAIAKLLVGDEGLNDRWNKINASQEYYKSTGELPIVAPKAEIIVTGDYKEQENCRKLISKLKGKISKATNKLPSADEKNRMSILTNVNVWEAQLKSEEAKMELIKSKANVKSR